MEKEQESLVVRSPKAGGAAHAAKVTPEKNAKGWTLHTDKHGNKAYVGPNNEVEEVK